LALPYDRAFIVITKAGRMVKAKPVGNFNPLFVFGAVRRLAPGSFRGRDGCLGSRNELSLLGDAGTGRCVAELSTREGPSPDLGRKSLMRSFREEYEHNLEAAVDFGVLWRGISCAEPRTWL
jgi:hypothetical protein